MRIQRRYWWWSVGVGASLVVLEATGCTPGRDHSDISSAGQAIVNGDVVTTPEGSGLVWINRNGLGSGVLLTNEWALTAAHVVAGNEACPPDLPNIGNVRARCSVRNNTVTVHLGNGITASDAHVATRVSIHPLFSQGPNLYAVPDTASVDAALVRTTAFSVNGTTTGHHFDLAASPPTAGAQYTAYGYGPSTDPRNPNEEPTSHSGTFVLGDVDAFGHMPWSAPTGSMQFAVGGDSGGPYFSGLIGGGGPVEAIHRTSGDVTPAADFSDWKDFVLQSVDDFNVDYDVDGTPDAMFWMRSGSEIVLQYQSHGQGTVLIDTPFHQSTSSLGNLDTLRTAIGDFNGDGNLDVVGITSTARFYLTGTSSGGQAVGFWPVRVGTHQIVRGVDRDGQSPDDIEVVEDTGRVLTYFGIGNYMNCTDPPTPVASLNGPDHYAALSYVLADTSGDGVKDVVMVGRNDEDTSALWIRHLLSDGRACRGDSHTTFVTGNVPQFAAGDFDGSGFEDYALRARVTGPNGQHDELWYFLATGNGPAVFTGKLLVQPSAGPSIARVETANFKDPESPDTQDVVAILDDQSGKIFWGGASGPSSTNFSVVGGLPTISASDGKMLTVTGEGFETYRSPYMELRLTSTEPNAYVQIYDGDYGGGLDQVGDPNTTCYQVYDDPCQDGLGDCGLGPVTLFPGSVKSSNELPDAEWKTIFNADQQATLGQGSQPGSPRYHYRIVIYQSATGNCSLDRAAAKVEANASVTPAWSVFKVRANGFVSYQYGEIQFIGTDVLGGDGIVNRVDAPPDFMRESLYDGNFTFRFSVSTAVQTTNANIQPIEADADNLGTTPRGQAFGANEQIRFELKPAGGTAVNMLLVTNPGPNETTAPAGTSVRPSGNFNNEPNGDRDQRTYRVDPTARQAGEWNWEWTNVLAVNNIHIWPPTASPVAWELYSGAGTKLSTTVAVPRETWLTRAPEIGSRLPIVLGSTNSNGSPVGESAIITSVSQALQLLGSTSTNPWQQVSQELLAMHLNVLHARSLGQELTSALVEGGRRSVRTLVSQGNAAVRGPRALVPSQDLHDLVLYLQSVNKGQLTHFRPGVPIPNNPGDDPDQDGVISAADNCPEASNPNQEDSDADGIGDACRLEPTLQCVLPTGSTSFRAYLGYFDPLPFRSIQVGPRNRFNGTADRGQPTEFAEGEQDSVFTVDFTAGQTLEWTLDGEKLRIASDLEKCGGDVLTEVNGLDHVAGFASDNVFVEDGVVVDSSATLLAGNDVHVETAARVGNVWASDDVILGFNTVVSGTAVAGDDVVRLGATVQGPILENAFVPSHSLSWTMTFAAHSPNVIVFPGQNVVLAPGAYGKLSVQLGGKVRLSAGTYMLEQLDTARTGELIIDESAGPVRIYVRDWITHDGTTRSATSAAISPTIGYFGILTAFVRSNFTGTIIAPKGTIKLGLLGTTSQFTGAFFGKTLSLQRGVTLHAFP